MSDVSSIMEGTVRRLAVTNQVQALGWVEQCWRTDAAGNHFDYRDGDHDLTLTFGAYGVLEEFALTTPRGTTKAARGRADVEDFVRTLIHALVHLPTTEETPPMTTTVNASRDGIIDLALDSGWVIGKERHPDGGLTLSNLRNTSSIQFVLHFEDGDLERVEYSDGEQGTPDWIPDNPEERAFQLCRIIVGPGGHVPDPALVKLRHDVEELERGMDSRFYNQTQRIDNHGRDINRIYNRLETVRVRTTTAVGVAAFAILGEVVLAIAILAGVWA